MDFNELLLKRRAMNIKYKMEMVENRVQTFVDNTDYVMETLNGQRIILARGSSHRISKGCEIFIGKIPRDMFEDEIIPIFERIGPIFKLRLMLDFSGINRGYGFLIYFNQEHANLAVSILHGYEVRRGRHIGVYKSVDNCRLFVGGIPTDKSKQDVQEAMSDFVTGIRNVIMYPSHENKKLNRGFVFVEFEDHRSAAMARRKLSPGALILWEAPILVDWADPLPEVDSEVMSKVTKLYVRNLEVDMSNEELFQIVTGIIKPELIVKVHKILDYAFIHLVSRKAAEEALGLLKAVQINGNPIEVTWARPRVYSKKNRIDSTPHHFCTSLPPRIRKQMQQIPLPNSMSRSNTSPDCQSPLLNYASSSSSSFPGLGPMYCDGGACGINVNPLSQMNFGRHTPTPNYYPMNRSFLNMPLQFN